MFCFLSVSLLEIIKVPLRLEYCSWGLCPLMNFPKCTKIFHSVNIFVKDIYSENSKNFRNFISNQGYSGYTVI